MFIGHFAVGFASKRVAPRASLAPLLAAPLLADLLWPVCLLLGVEQVQIRAPGGNPFLTLTFTAYPWSHSLVMNVVWAGLLGGVYYAITKYGRGALVIALAVVSHWALDVVTHVPDMPISPWSPRLIGLGLWNSVPATVVVESLMLIAGVWLYSTGTAARDRIGRYGWWGLVLFVVVGYVMNLRGAPPPSVMALAWTGVVAGALTTLWAWWVDRHRAPSIGA